MTLTAFVGQLCAAARGAKPGSSSIPISANAIPITLMGFLLQGAKRLAWDIASDSASVVRKLRLTAARYLASHSGASNAFRSISGHRVEVRDHRGDATPFPTEGQETSSPLQLLFDGRQVAGHKRTPPSRSPLPTIAERPWLSAQPARAARPSGAFSHELRAGAVASCSCRPVGMSRNPDFILSSAS